MEEGGQIIKKVILESNILINEFHKICRKALSKRDPRELNISKKEVSEILAERKRLNIFYRDVIKDLFPKLKEYNEIKKKLIDYYKRKQYGIKDTKSGSLKILLDEDSYIWFRVSKTEADVLRVISDAPKKEQAETIIKEALNLIKNK